MGREITEQSFEEKGDKKYRGNDIPSFWTEKIRMQLAGDCLPRIGKRKEAREDVDSPERFLENRDRGLYP